MVPAGPVASSPGERIPSEEDLGTVDLVPDSRDGPHDTKLTGGAGRTPRAVLAAVGLAALAAIAWLAPSGIAWALALLLLAAGAGLYGYARGVAGVHGALHRANDGTLEPVRLPGAARALVDAARGRPGRGARR